MSSTISFSILLETIKFSIFLIVSNKIEKDIADDIRYSVIANINNYIHDNHHMKAADLKFESDVKFTKDFLKKNSDLFFTNSDKCNNTVATYKKGYIESMEGQLQDQSTYQKLDYNPLEE